MKHRRARAGLSALVALSRAGAAAAAEVSYHREIAPLLARHCLGCHHPGKEKGGIDLTRVSAIHKGGRHGPGLVPGDPGASRLIAEVGGADPAMPKEGERLGPAQVARLEQWIREGARDDSPPPPARRTGPTAYAAAPILGPLEFTVDDRWLLVAGHHEVVVFDPATLGRRARWAGAPPRIEALRLSPDGRRLAVVGGDPGVSGEVQVRDVDTGRELVRAVVSPDTLLGVDWSP
ncbi:MAG: c-type cytochrome domain-containing protein, partial [Verrucomicrobiota bacterium]